jgi:hypothetical protein
MAEDGRNEEHRQSKWPFAGKVSSSGAEMKEPYKQALSGDADADAVGTKIRRRGENRVALWSKAAVRVMRVPGQRHGCIVAQRF